MSDETVSDVDSNSPTEQMFRITGVVKAFEKRIDETSIGKSYVNKLALIQMEDSDEWVRLCVAHLPDEVGERVELAAYIGYPVEDKVRVAFFKGPDHYSEKHYLFVMTTSAAHKLFSLNGKRISLRVLPLSQVDAADYAKDPDQGAYEAM